jgi:hypothetical protein
MVFHVLDQNFEFGIEPVDLRPHAPELLEELPENLMFLQTALRQPFPLVALVGDRRVKDLFFQLRVDVQFSQDVFGNRPLRFRVGRRLIVRDQISNPLVIRFEHP